MPENTGLSWLAQVELAHKMAISAIDHVISTASSEGVKSIVATFAQAIVSEVSVRSDTHNIRGITSQFARSIVEQMSTTIGHAIEAGCARGTREYLETFGFPPTIVNSSTKP